MRGDYLVFENPARLRGGRRANNLQSLAESIQNGEIKRTVVDNLQHGDVITYEPVIQRESI